MHIPCQSWWLFDVDGLVVLVQVFGRASQSAMSSAIPSTRQDEPDEYTRAGQAAYTPFVLKFFDWYSYHWVMHTDTRQSIQDLYRRNLSSPHLEAGAGTCYSLCRALQPGRGCHELILLDLNPHCLAYSNQRLVAYNPILLQADVLKPVPYYPTKFASIGLSYVISVLPHNVPGGKWQVLKHLAQALDEDGVLFGVVSPGEMDSRSLAARIRFWILNRVQILDNEHDTLQDLEQALKRHFEQVDLQILHGDVLFEARKPRKI